MEVKLEPGSLSLDAPPLQLPALPPAQSGTDSGLKIQEELCPRAAGASHFPLPVACRLVSVYDDTATFLRL